MTAVLSLHPQSSKAGEEGAKELCEGNGRGEDGDANVAEDGTWEGENPKHLVGIFLKSDCTHLTHCMDGPEKKLTPDNFLLL